MQRNYQQITPVFRWSYIVTQSVFLKIDWDFFCCCFIVKQIKQREIEACEWAQSGFFLNNLIPFYRNSAIIVRSEKNRVFW